MAVVPSWEKDVPNYYRVIIFFEHGNHAVTLPALSEADAIIAAEKICNTPPVGVGKVTSCLLVKDIRALRVESRVVQYHLS